MFESMLKTMLGIAPQLDGFEGDLEFKKGRKCSISMR